MNAVMNAELRVEYENMHEIPMNTPIFKDLSPTSEKKEFI